MIIFLKEIKRIVKKVLKKSMRIIQRKPLNLLKLLIQLRLLKFLSQLILLTLTYQME